MLLDRTGLKKPHEVEALQESILAVFNRYVCQQRKHSLGRWATILMKVNDSHIYSLAVNVDVTNSSLICHCHRSRI